MSAAFCITDHCDIPDVIFCWLRQQQSAVTNFSRRSLSKSSADPILFLLMPFRERIPGAIGHQLPRRSQKNDVWGSCENATPHGVEVEVATQARACMRRRECLSDTGSL